MPSSYTMPNKSVRFLRTLIIAQLLVAMWFEFSPEMLPATIQEAERLTDREIYAKIDTYIILMAHAQSVFCLLLWRPSRMVAYTYLLTTAVIAVLGVFSGPAILSALDAFFGYVQVLASGGMLGVLWIYGYFTLPPLQPNPS